VARHPDRNPDHKRSGLKPWLSAVGGKALHFVFPGTIYRLTRVKKRPDPFIKGVIVVKKRFEMQVQINITF